MHDLKSQKSFGSFLLIAVVAVLAVTTISSVNGAFLEQIHIAWGETPSDMTIMFASNAGPTTNSSAYAVYGLTANSMNSKAVYEEVRFFTDGNPDGLQYHIVVRLHNLTSSTHYFYQLFTDSNSSAIFEFDTMSSDPAQPVKFLVYGDFGLPRGGFTLPRLVQEVKKGGINGSILIGDMAYDMNDDGGKRGDNFMNQVQAYATTVPFMVCVGNHERNFNFSHYINRFAMPGAGRDSKNMWFSWDVGRAHFISYTTEAYFTDGPVQQQYDWLEQDLIAANLNRAERPWIIAFGHEPMYCSNADHDDCTSTKSVIRAGLETLFFNYGVDLILEAHEHSYERLWPVYNLTVTQHDYNNPRAPVHIITGVAGCMETYKLCVNPILKAQGPWSAKRTWLPGKYGYGRLEIVNATHLNWQQVLDVTLTVEDSITMIQTNHGPFKPLN